MGRRSLGKILVIALAGLLLVGAVVSAEEQQQAPPKEATPPTKKKPTLKPATTTTQPQPAATQATPSAAQKPKDKAPKDPKDAGINTIAGRITSVQPEQKQLIIRTNSYEIKVFVTPVTQLTRDGQTVELKALHANDKVETCRYNAMHVAQILRITSAEKNLTALPNPGKQ
jgi:hypothetical protein